MDSEDKEQSKTVETQSTTNTSIEQMDSFENEIVLKPCGKAENIETSVENSVTQKETVEILSNELVTKGTDLENTETESSTKLMDHEGLVNDSIQITNMEESAATEVVETVQPSQEHSEQLRGDENMVSNTETIDESSNRESEKVRDDDSNRESEIVLDTTTTAEDFFFKSTTILADIENINSSVDMQDTTSSKNDTNLTSPHTAVTSGLSLLAQYDSDDDSDDQNSDTDSVIEVPSTSAKDYRNQVVEINSDSDSDDSDSSSGVEYLNEIRKTIEKRTEVVNDEEDDDDEEGDDNEDTTGKKRHKPKLKVKGEMLLDDLPPIQDLQITVPEEECIEFGKIHSIVDQLLLVVPLPNAILLDLETVIFLDKGQKVLGKVFDVLGQVADPMYCVRFNSNKQIHEKDINIGDVVYVAPKTQYTQYVILSSLMKLKGSDASWENDIEPPPRFLDYSDDEQEQMARRQLRNKDRPVDNEDPPKKSRRSGERSLTIHHKNTWARRRADQQQDGGNYNNSHSQQQRYNQPNTHQRQQQQQPNYNRNSWHSNYYPQQYQGPPPQANYGYGNNSGAPSQNQQQTQHYANPNPMYAMPPMHTMAYPPPNPYGPQGGMPPHQMMPNTFSIRPPQLHGAPHQQQYTSPPPPPGSQ